MGQAKALLTSVRSRGMAGKSRRRIAATSWPDPVAVESKGKVFGHRYQEAGDATGRA
jgi:hypothetical protein